MTIASEITKLQTNLTNSYTAVDDKGGILPQVQNFDNLAMAISSIPSSSTPTLITKNITQNGTYNASSDNADGYSSVTVNVSGGGSFIGIPREIKNGIYQMPTTSFTFSLPSDVTTVSDYALSYAFYDCTGLTNVDFSSLTTVGRTALSYAFYNCTGLTNVDFSSLTTVGRMALFYAFYHCTGLTNVDFSSLTSVDSSGLSYAFNSCTGLTDIYFRALTTSSFDKYKNQFTNMMATTGTSKTHTIHFPNNMESTIQDLTGYPIFGGANNYVVCAFDLPATS